MTPDASSAIDARWLNIGAFEAAALGTFGNCGIGIARAPGYVNLDAAISKRFNAGGERYFEFRVEAFNVTNTPSFGPPARDISVPNTFGLITTTVSSPRVDRARAEVLLLKCRGVRGGGTGAPPAVLPAVGPGVRS